MRAHEQGLNNARDSGKKVVMRIDVVGPGEQAGPEDVDVDIDIEDEVEIENMVDESQRGERDIRVPPPVALQSFNTGVGGISFRPDVTEVDEGGEISRNKKKKKKQTYRVKMVTIDDITGVEEAMPCSRTVRLAFLQVSLRSCSPSPALLNLSVLNHHLPPLLSLPRLPQFFANSTAPTAAMASSITGTPPKSVTSPKRTCCTSRT